MDVYIQSRGFDLRQEYSWLKISERVESREAPPLTDEFKNLIDSDASSLSLVLGRLNGQLILYVVGLQSTDRKDFARRTIGNSGVWVSHNSNDESVIQALVVQALRNELGTAINSAVKSHEQHGFQVIESERGKLFPTGVNGELDPNMENKIGNLLRKQQLADEISKLKFLPDKEGLLVVITGISKKEELETAGVWRGLSSQIKTEEETWENTKDIVVQSANFLMILSRIIKKFFPLRKGLVLLVLIISLTVNIILFYNFESIQSLNKHNQKLKLENQELEGKNKKLIIKDQELRTQIIDKVNQEFNLQKAVEDLKKQRNHLEGQVNALESQVNVM